MDNVDIKKLTESIALIKAKNEQISKSIEEGKKVKNRTVFISNRNKALHVNREDIKDLVLAANIFEDSKTINDSFIHDLIFILGLKVVARERSAYGNRGRDLFSRASFDEKLKALKEIRSLN